jgi:MoaA/NifB/PqqE/SkfB family radical SAM enzyme
MKTDLDKKIANGSFCVLPWIHDFRHLDGRKHLCCNSYSENLPLNEDFNSESTQEIRRKLWNGEKIPHCNTCYKLEKNGVPSYRQTFSQEWINDYPEVREYFENWNETKPPQLFYYDLRYNDKCNLACISCGPDFSTLWKKEVNIPIKEYKLNVDYNEILKAKKIYFAGGEPLIIDDYTDLLKFLAENDSQARITISTNLVSLRPQVLEYIKALKDCNLVVSVDSYGSTLEYVRYPLRWEKFLSNLRDIQAAGIDYSFNTVASAISVLGWKHFAKLEEFKPKSWWIFPLEYPHELRMENIPTELKPYAYDQVLPMKATDMYKNDQRFQQEIDHVLERILAPGNDEDLKGYCHNINQRRKINMSDYVGINLWDYK